MSTRFNRNDTNVPDDRLFPSDFIVDQNGQDTDILQLAKDLGCLPCLGSGLEVTSYNQTNHQVAVSAGWAYDDEGHRITVESQQLATLTDTDGGDNYIILSHQFETDTSRPAHRTGVSYDTRKKDSFLITVTDSSPGVNDICLANCKQTGTGTITVDVNERTSTGCKLTSQSSLPGLGYTEPGAEPPKGGTMSDLPDPPKGRKIPMPIILGMETVLAEELGRTTAAVSNLTLERVSLKAGTPVADVKLWIGDWGSGSQRGATGDDRYICDFDMQTLHSGITSWDDDLWITGPDDDPPGPGYYYLVAEDESWYAKIIDSGSNWVQVEIKSGNEIPGTGTYYICPYADKYRVEAVPYKTDVELNTVYAVDSIEVSGNYSPTRPVVTIKGLNLGGKYKLKIASMITSENFTKWAYSDFIVGADLLLCWQPAASYITANAVDGGVDVVIPGIIADTALPEAYELCYTYGSPDEDVPEPDFDNPDHATVRVKDRRIKLDVPPGYKVRIKVRAINRRMIMRCSGSGDIILTTADFYVTAGGVGLRRNRKSFTGVISEANVPAGTAELADQVPLPNPVWPEKIFLFNNTGSSQTNFEVYVHGSNQVYTDGRKISIGTGGDYPNIGSKGSAEVTVADFKITDPGMKITVKNTDSGSQSINLSYGVQYREDYD